MLARDSEFEVIPAVDVLAGRAVRLAQGRPDRVTAREGDPVTLARRFAADGATRLHVVDLDGALSGTWNRALLTAVAGVGLPVQFGGGLRTLDDVEKALAAGADRVMIGTAALRRGLLRKAAPRFGEALVVAVDARDGNVVVDGWQRPTRLSPTQLALRCADAGVARLLVTSTNRDGMLAGPDLQLLADVLEAGLPVLAAGGIATTEDVVAVRDAGCEGVIVGSALLHGRLRLDEAVAAVASS